jgi:flagellar biosynthetic protein FlhB
MSDEASPSDKAHEATPDRLRKAREKGDVAVSPEVAVLASLAGLLLGVALAGGAVLSAAEALSGAFTRPEALAAAVLAGEEVGLTRAGLDATLALLLPPAALVVAGLLVQGAFVVAPSKLKPSLQKISPVKNAGKRYGPSGLGEFARSSAKVTLTVLLGGALLWSQRESYLGAVGLPLGALPALLKAELVRVLLVGAAIAAGVAAIDLPVRRARHAAKLRMSRQELSDETKEQEGDPTQKQSRRKRAGEIARNRMLVDAGKADVVIVNPTHYAVALQWQRGQDTVPKCVAKGTDHLALAIIERARAGGVPIREDRTTARALHAAVEVGGFIEAEHYAAVAAAIRFAEAVRRDRKG